MTSKTTNKSSPEVRTRAVRMVLDHEGEHASQGISPRERSRIWR
jgi:transposase